jgi:hypothetical protein
MAADVASVQFSRTVERRERRPASACFAVASSSGRVLAGTGGRRSLKTQQHAGVVCGLRHVSPASSNGARSTAAIQPGSVDMLGPIRLDIAGLGPVLGTGGSATARAGLATGSGSGHR